MSKYAFIFPGQGAQYTGMGLDFYENFECSKQVFETANKVLNKNVSEICFRGSEDDLKKTINTQSAILAVEVSILEAFKSKVDIKPSFVAGHSLGEYAALYAAGVLNLENVFIAIQKRAELMDAETTKTEGGMAAILGLNPDIIKDKLIENVAIANYNEPNQTVITGIKKDVLKLSETLKECGAKRVVPLAVSGAFHSPFMKGASLEFEKFVKTIKLNDAKVPVITNVDGIETVKSDDFIEKMPKQISNSVFWTQTINKMVEKGVDTFIEMGPGKVLSGLNRKICPDVKTYSIFDLQSFKECIKEI